LKIRIKWLLLYAKFKLRTIATNDSMGPPIYGQSILSESCRVNSNARCWKAMIGLSNCRYCNFTHGSTNNDIRCPVPQLISSGCLSLIRVENWRKSRPDAISGNSPYERQRNSLSARLVPFRVHETARRVSQLASPSKLYCLSWI